MSRFTCRGWQGQPYLGTGTQGPSGDGLRDAPYTPPWRCAPSGPVSKRGSPASPFLFWSAAPNCPTPPRQPHETHTLACTRTHTHTHTYTHTHTHWLPALGVFWPVPPAPCFLRPSRAASLPSNRSSLICSRGRSVRFCALNYSCGDQLIPFSLSRLKPLTQASRRHPPSDVSNPSCSYALGSHLCAKEDGENDEGCHARDEAVACREHGVVENLKGWVGGHPWQGSESVQKLGRWEGVPVGGCITGSISRHCP